MKNVIGVSIGTRHMKFTVVNRGRIVDFFSIELPENAIVDEAVAAWSALGSQLKAIRKEHHFPTKNCAIVLPDSGTYVRHLTMPAMTDKQMSVNLPYEFRDILQDESDQYIFDYSMIDVQSDEDGKPVEMELIGAAVSKHLIEQYQEMFASAGLKLIKATPRVIALQDLIQELNGDTGNDSALLDLGSSYSRIDIFKNGIYEVTRSIDMGVNQIVEAAGEVLNCDPHIAKEYLLSNKDDVENNEALITIYDNIAIEVMRALNYYTYENQNNTLETLYYCGSGSSLEPFLHEIRQNISLRLAPISELNPDYGDALMESPSSVGVTAGD